ncbi:dephospho-CoA kinase [Flavobacterium sp. '19STA2R22 D10 B1']|uniref:dephospho-CoA kinase n=1 Tax=Flavobacterium aerium TaxID=3037261 RepID=UPI00278C3078|nr:dephospho-CoA kinase [Flavobacterium sp. '19STA2R22 D10 B1']
MTEKDIIQKPKIVGLTGGIGSGKTTIAKYFESLGVPIYIADSEAKKLMDTPIVMEEIQNVFGKSIVVDGHLDRTKISEIVFQDKSKLEVLNKIVHPAVREHFEEWVQEHKNESVVIKEAAILFESGSYKDCDAIILVTAPEEVRIQRVMSRDGVKREEVMQRINNQWSDDLKKSLSNYIIDNEDLDLAMKKARFILEKLRKQ